MPLDFQNLALLPSQESLLQRLHHIASYSEQLKVVAGESGSGKSTLVTVLIDELDQFNSALVVCPQNSDDAEIRRKILVQLLHDPLFDDEVPLAETMLRVKNSLTKPIHIVIDDAQFLSTTLWAECLMLCQIRCASKPVSITLTANTGFLVTLMSQLSSESKELILPITIDPLTISEREGMYFSLMSRTDLTPFTPRDIVRKQLEGQSGTPAEVVALLDLALHGEPNTKTFPSRVLATAAIMLCLVSIAIIGWMYSNDTELQSKSVRFASQQKPHPAVVAYGKRVLMPYFNLREQEYLQSGEEADSPRLTGSLTSERRGGGKYQEPVKAQPINLKLTAEGVEEPVISELLQDAKAVADVKIALVVGDKSELNNELAAVKQTSESAPIVRQVFTVQLAKLSQVKSLNVVLKQLKETEDVFVLRDKGYYVVTVGNYVKRSNAEQAAVGLSQSGSGFSPWLRKWAELHTYELHKHYPNGEIVQ